MEGQEGGGRWRETRFVVNAMIRSFPGTCGEQAWVGQDYRVGLGPETETAPHFRLQGSNGGLRRGSAALHLLCSYAIQRLPPPKGDWFPVASSPAGSAKSLAAQPPGSFVQLLTAAHRHGPLLVPTAALRVPKACPTRAPVRALYVCPMGHARVKHYTHRGAVRHRPFPLIHCTRPRPAVPAFARPSSPSQFVACSTDSSVR